MKKRGLLAFMALAAMFLLLILSGCSQPTDSGGGTPAAPARVSELRGTVASGSVTLTWTDPADTDHIEITWTGGSGGPGGPETASQGEESKTITGLENNTTYAFTVVAVDSGGGRSAGTVIYRTPKPNPASDTVPPGVVYGFSYTVTGNTATLKWTDPLDADLDKIEITWTPGDGGPQTVNSGDKTATITGLEDGAVYTVSFVAVDGFGNSGKPASFTLTTTTLGVSKLRGTVESGQVTLSWVDPDYADFDHVEITWTSESGSGSATVNKGVRYKTIPSLTDNTEYTFTVTVQNSSNEDGGPGETITLTPAAASFSGQVTNLTAVPGRDYVDLSWDDPADGSFDRVEITWTAGAGGFAVADKGVWRATLTGLTEGTAYTFTVRAVDAGGRPGTGVSSETATPQEFSRWTVNQLGSASILNIAGNTDRFVSAVASTTPLTTPSPVYRSPNGKTWTYTTVSTTVPSGTSGALTWTFPANKIAWLNNKFIAVGASGIMASSSDGTAWEWVFGTSSDVISPFGTTAIYDIAWSGSTYVAVGASGKMAYSSDGITWNAIAAGTEAGQSGFAATIPINRVAWSGGKFVAVGGTTTSSAIATSSDGINWTAVLDASPFTKSIKDIAWGNGKFVAVDSAGVIAWSTDGSSWTKVGPGSGYAFNAVAWGGTAGSFTAAANSGYILAFE
jgi:hypothetical protein